MQFESWLNQYHGIFVNNIHVASMLKRAQNPDIASWWCEQMAFARIFSHKRPLSARGKILYFATIMDTNRDSAH